MAVGVGRGHGSVRAVGKYAHVCSSIGMSGERARLLLAEMELCVSARPPLTQVELCPLLAQMALNRQWTGTGLCQRVGDPGLIGI